MKHNKPNCPALWLAMVGAILPFGCVQAQQPAAQPLPAAAASEEGPALAGGTSLLPAGGLSAFRVAGDAKGTMVREVAAEGQPFEKALQFQIDQKPDRDYAIRLNATVAAPVEAGDVIVATFWMRGIETKDEGGEALSAFVFEQAKAPYDKSADVVLSAPLGAAWKRFRLPFAAKGAFGAGEATIQFRLGAAAQTFEIGGLSVVNYGKTVKMADFPKPVVTYAGREPDAAWRTEAAARIEKIRKGDLKIIVKDAGGHPLKDATVQVRMKRHAFGFGSVVNTGRLIRPQKTTEEEADQRKYREMFPQLFNMTVDEGSHKWPAWSNPQLRAEVLQTVDWMRAHNIKMRGHVMVWPSWDNSPKYLKREYDRIVAEQGAEAGKTYLRDEIKKHILDVGTTNRGKLVAWDVVNETYSNSDLQTILGHESLVEWFKLAKQADPEARLFINENTILTANGRKRDFYEKEIKFLLDNGAPLEGIGMQGHIGTPTSPAELLRTLDRFGKFKLPIQVTEFDFGLQDTDPQLAADFTRDFMTVCFSHPAVSDIVMWGFWEGQHWRPYKALWRKDWSIKPNGQAWMDLVHKAWWTNADGVTSTGGEYATRGFLGDYEVTVASGGKTKTVPVTLGKDGQTLVVSLD